MYVDWKKYETGLEYYKRSVQLLDTIADFEVLGIRYNNIGMVYQLMEKHREAITWFEKAQKLMRKKKNSIRLGIRYFNIGNSYLALKNYQKQRISLEGIACHFSSTVTCTSGFKNIWEVWVVYICRKAILSRQEEHLLHSARNGWKGGNIPEISICYSKLYQFYKQTGNLRKRWLPRFYTVAKIRFITCRHQSKLKNSKPNTKMRRKSWDLRLEKENDLKIKELTFRKRERNWAIAGAFLFVAAGVSSTCFQPLKAKAKLSEQNLELDRLNKTLNRLFAIISHDLRNATAAYQK